MTDLWSINGNSILSYKQLPVQSKQYKHYHMTQNMFIKVIKKTSCSSVSVAEQVITDGVIKKEIC